MSGNSPRSLLHIPPTDPPQRIYRLADSPRRDFGKPRWMVLDPSAEGAMTTARPPLSRTICPCLSLLSTDCCLTPRCHTLRRCSLTVRTLCLRREEWNHDPPAFTTRNSYWRRRQDYSSLSVRHAALSILSKGAYEHPSVKRIATGSWYID